MKITKIATEPIDLLYPSELNYVQNLIYDLTQKIIQEKQNLLNHRIKEHECENCVISVYEDDYGNVNFTAEKNGERIRLITFIETKIDFNPFEPINNTFKHEFKYY